MAKKKISKGRQIISKISLGDKISALYGCADILDYPNDNHKDIIKTVEKLTQTNFDSDKIALEDLCSEYISIFSINATKLKCVPFASWWIDGKMSGKTLSKIVDFYAECGYRYDAEMMKKPADNVSSMISFIAILAQENRFKEIKEFAKFLTWLDDFAISLEKATDIKSFFYAVNISNKIINSFKEKL